MEPTSKFFAKSVAFWGIALTALSSFIHARTGVNVDDQVAPLTAIFQKLINDLPPVVSDIGIIAGLITALLGRFKATQPLHIVAPSGTGNNPGGVSTAWVLLAVGLASGFSGCSVTNTTGSSTLGAIFSVAGPFAAKEAGIQAVRESVGQLGGKPGGPTKAQIATDELTIANVGNEIVSQQVTSKADIVAIFLAFKSDANTQQYATEAQDVADQLLLQVQAHPDAQRDELLSDFFLGMKVEATAEGGVLPAAPAAPSSTTTTSLTF